MAADVHDRVRKLLALATSPNVHEAASAAAAAQALVERHRLEGWLAAEASTAADPVTDGREAPLEVARRPRRWKVALAAGLAEANGCLAYSALQGEDTLLLLAGRAADRAAVAEIWGWLVTRLEWLSATHGPGRSRAWHEAFRIGAAEVIAERLAGARAEVQASFPTAALVRIEPERAARAAAVEAFAERHLHLGRGRALRVDGRGLAQGRAAGAAMKLRAE
jgi:hypothetical protein